MKKSFDVPFIITIFILFSGLIIYGCGQSTPSVTTTVGQPSGLVIRGTVFSTTISDKKGDPIPYATVVLSGASQSQRATTSSSGEYAFYNVADGNYNIIVTAECHQRSSNNPVSIKPETNIPADNTVTVKDVQLNSRPIILSYSPTYDAIISLTPTIVVRFNEPMETSLWTSRNIVFLPVRTRTYDTSGSDTTVRWSWSENDTVLTITPETSLLPNMSVNLYVDSLGTARDRQGYRISTEAEQAVSTSNLYRTSSGGVPAAPVNLSISFDDGVNEKAFIADATYGINFNDVIVNYSNSYLKLLWEMPTQETAPVTGFVVYLALEHNGELSNYQKYTTSSLPRVSLSFGSPANAVINSGAIDAIFLRNQPFVNDRVHFKVAAYNGDGESAAATLATKECVRPQVIAKAWDSNTAAAGIYHVLDNGYVLNPITADNVVYMFFNEPILPETVTASNFAIIGTPTRTVSSVKFLTSYSRTLDATAETLKDSFCVAKIVANAAIAGGTYTIRANSGGVRDLAGNPMGSSNNTTDSLD